MTHAVLPHCENCLHDVLRTHPLMKAREEFIPTLATRCWQVSSSLTAHFKATRLKRRSSGRSHRRRHKPTTWPALSAHACGPSLQSRQQR